MKSARRSHTIQRLPFSTLAADVVRTSLTQNRAPASRMVDSMTSETQQMSCLAFHVYTLCSMKTVMFIDRYVERCKASGQPPKPCATHATVPARISITRLQALLKKLGAQNILLKSPDTKSNNMYRLGLVAYNTNRWYLVEAMSPSSTSSGNGLLSGGTW